MSTLLTRFIPDGVGRNAFFLALSASAKGVSTIVFLVLAVRTLEKSATGEVIIIFLAIRIVQNVAGAGLGRYLARETAYHPDATGRLTLEVVKLLGVAAGVLGLLSMAVVGFIDVKVGVALSAAVVAAMSGSAQQALGGAFLGRGKPQWDSVAEIVAGTILVCGGLMVAITDGGPAMFIGVVAASRTVACATLAGLFSHTLGPVGDIQHASLRHAFTAGLPYMINAAASFVFLRADIILLGVLSGAVAVSVYGSVADPLVTLSATVHVINTAFLPGLASAGSDERPSLARRMLGLDLLIGCILAALVFFGAEPFVATVLNEEDTASAVVLRVLSVAIALRFISNGLATWLTASGHHWRRTAIATFAGVFNVLVNIIAIPLWGYWAAVGTTIVTEALILCLSIAAVRPEWHMSTGGYLGGHPPATAPKGSHLGSD